MSDTEWTPRPYKFAELRVFVHDTEQWIPVEPVSFPVTSRAAGDLSVDLMRHHQKHCPGLGHDFYKQRGASITLVRTAPGLSWSAIWVPTSDLRKPHVEETHDD